MSEGMARGWDRKGIRVRVACPQDTPAVRQLWDTCFPCPDDFNGFFFRELYRPAFTLLLEETATGTLCAMTQTLPCRLRLTAAGEGTPNRTTVEEDATYIYGACTAPAYRRRGYMAELLRRTALTDIQNQRVASLLIPAEPWLFDFYRPFGYEPFFTVEQHTVTRCASDPQDTSNPRPRDRTRTGPPPRRLTSADIPALAARYEAIPSPCLVCRTPTDWAALLRLFDATGQGAYGWFEAGQLTAYAFCWPDNVQEAVGLTPQQEQDLLSILERDSFPYTTYEHTGPPADQPADHSPTPDTSAVSTQTLGCIRWYDSPRRDASTGPPVSAGYMNLMLN